MNKVGIVITCKDYNEWVQEAVDSVVDQTLKDIQCVVIDDNSKELVSVVGAAAFSLTQITNTTTKGLAASANLGFSQINAKYLVRLDADDRLHPEFCRTLAGILDSDESIDFVYTDARQINEDGALTGEILSQSSIPHGSCMMMRASLFQRSGGYEEIRKVAEDAEFYKRILELGAKGYHCTLPLWYYRRHGAQMSANHSRRVKARSEIDKDTPNILCVIPARGGSKGVKRKNLREIAGVSLIQRAIRKAKLIDWDVLIVVSSEDDEILEVADSMGVDTIRRPQELSADDVSLIPVARHAMWHLDEQGFYADIVITMQPTCPFTPVHAIDEALDRIVQDSELSCLVSVCKVRGTHPYRAYLFNEKGKSELWPFNPMNAERYLQRQDRPDAYGFTGGFYIRRRHLLENWNEQDFALGDHPKGIEVTQQEGLDIDDELDMTVARVIAEMME